MASVTALVAHQGGWDEILLVVGPVVVIIAALTLAKRRVDRLERSGSGVGGNQDATSGSGVGGNGDGVDVSGDHPTR